MTIGFKNYRSYEWLKWVGWILLFILLWFEGCKDKSVDGYSVTKPVKGTFKTVQPKQNPLTKESIYEKTKKRPRDSNNYIEKETKKYYKTLENRLYEMTKENDSLKQNYISLPDTLKQKEYNKAISLNLFEQKFEDKNQKALFTGVVQGQIKEVKFIYELKPQPIPATKFRLLAGINISNTLLFDKPLFNANLGFQNQKGNIIEVGYDTDKRINIGFKKSIFKIVK